MNPADASIGPYPGGGPRPVALEGGVITAGDVVETLISRWRLVLGLPLLLLVAIVAWSLAQPRTYTASSSFIPQSGRENLGSLSGLAAEFGFRVPTGDAGESPEFYAELMTSRAILSALVRTEYASSPSAEERATLVDLYDVDAPLADLRFVEALDRLRDDLTVSTSRQTGVVAFAVTSTSPYLAEQIARRMLELLNEFNLQTRQTHAAAERVFVGERMEERRLELRSAEQAVAAFLEQNRQFQGSPALALEYERLQREVTMRQSIVNSLAQAFEEARINEIRNTSVLTVIDSPARPVRPDPRGLITLAALALALGGVLAVLIAFGLEFGQRVLREDPRAHDLLLGSPARWWRGVGQRLRPTAGKG